MCYLKTLLCNIKFCNGLGGIEFMTVGIGYILMLLSSILVQVKMIIRVNLTWCRRSLNSMGSFGFI